VIWYAAQNFDVERFNFRKLNEVEVRNWYQVKISNRFAALENLNDSKDRGKMLKRISTSQLERVYVCMN
jgi:hypothetical protein